MSTSKDRAARSIRNIFTKGDKPTKNPTQPPGTNPGSSPPAGASSSHTPTKNLARPPVPTFDSVPTTMLGTPVPSQDSSHQLYCHVEGEPFVFSVTVGPDCKVDELKKVIQRERQGGSLKDVDPFTLELWKVNIDLSSCSESSLRHFKLELDSEGVEKMASWNSIGEYWLNQPPTKHLHIIVKASTNSTSFQVPSAPLNASPRRDTVAALYQRLKMYGFIQVRGTPASGKTVLGQLLAAHISRQDPDVHIIWVYGWPEECGDYHGQLKKLGWKEGMKTVFIFDEAQTSYGDARLWGEFFKSMRDHQERRAIIFTSYGSPTSRLIIKGTPMIIPDPQRVTLRHLPHDDGLPSAGLLFTRSEFDDLVNKYYPRTDFYFHLSFFDQLYGITNGHVGAIHDFTRIIISDRSYRELKPSAGRLYTWDLFLAEVSLHELLWKLREASTFGRGLPTEKDLQDPAIAGIFSVVLRKGVAMDADFRTEDEKRALQECFHYGWLHADNLGVIDLLDDIGYLFPSSLHRWYVEWRLLDSLSPIQFQANSLLEFVIDVIRLFSPRLLSAERRIGPGCIQRLPEAQYQDELYRCCHSLSKGSLITFPEFGTAKGRVDFYIPSKAWGIELLRDGNQLTSHCGRFSQTGSYGATIPLSEYIVIDCRTTRPKEQHPSLPNLYHAVFEDNFQSVCILDNKLNPVSGGKFRLLAGF